MISYFSICGLNVLNKLEELPVEREKLIDWIYYHQIDSHLGEVDYGLCGFRGSCSLINKKDSDVR
jgi:prenyltransferase beta subunit